MKKLTREDRILWFFKNYYETGMELSHLLNTITEEDLDNFEWYGKKLDIPKYEPSPCQNHDLQMEDEEKYVELKNKLFIFTPIYFQWNHVNGWIFKILDLDFKINDKPYEGSLLGIDTSFKTFLYIDFLFKTFKIYDKTDE